MADDTKFAQFQRLEPRTRPDRHGGSLEDALAATVADPLFLLARQWQLAEFQGEDGGSPIASRMTTEATPISRFRPGETGDPVDLPTDRPLEHLVEHGTDPGLTVRETARCGLRFLTMLGPVGDKTVDDVLTTCPLPGTGIHARDTAGQSLHRVLAARAPDAVALAARLRDGWQPSGLTGDQVGRFRDAAKRWLAWFAAEHPGAGEPCWVSERLEHRFSLGASFPGQEVGLTVPEFGGGRVEGYHFDLDLRPGRGLGAAPKLVESPEARTLATRAGYPGMPAERWWEFEDDTVNLPSISAGPVDLARLLLISFANVYGNDWWIIPVDLRVGQVHRIKSLTVTDTFGDEVDIEPTDLVHEDGWSVFRLTDAATGRPGPAWLPLPPTAGHLVEGPPVEEVMFVRDEMANLGWAIERVVQGATGRPRPRHTESPEPEAVQLSADALTYRLETPVPEHWIPLVAVPLWPGSDAVKFRRGRIPRFDEQGVRLDPVLPAGRILERTDGPVTFRDEEISRAGVHVTRTPVLTRWHGGGVFAWTSRRAQTGQGEAASNLQYDAAIPPRTVSG